MTTDCEVVCCSNVFTSHCQHLTESFFSYFFLASVCSSPKQQIMPLLPPCWSTRILIPRDKLMIIFSQPDIFPLYLHLLSILKSLLCSQCPAKTPGIWKLFLLLALLLSHEKVRAHKAICLSLRAPFAGKHLGLPEQGFL